MLNKKFLSILTFLWISVCVFLSLNLTLRYINNPLPFLASNWDQRWLFIFGILILGISLLYLFAKDILLLWVSVAGFLVIAIVPVFTMNAVRPYFALFIVIFFSLGVGHTFVNRFLRTVMIDRAEKAALSLLFGLSAIMVLRSIQGALGLINPIITSLVLIILFIGFVFPHIRLFRDVVRSSINTLINNLENDYSSMPILAAVFLILFVPSWLIALSPPMRYDEMTYHLSGPLFYLQHGGIVRFPEGGANPWLHYAEMLYTLSIELGGLSAARLMHYVMTLLSAVFVYVSAKQLQNQRAAVISALAFLTIPLVAYEGATAYIDLFVTAYTTAFGYCFIRYWKDANRRWLLAAGIFGGIGLGIKLSAGPMMLAILVCFGLLMFWEKRYKQMSLLTLTGVIILLFSVPWWIRDYIWRGDPFFPYGMEFLQRVNSVQVQIAEGSNRMTPTLLERLASYPIDIVLNSRKYYHEAPGAMAATLPFLALPLWLLSPSVGKQEKKILVLMIIASIMAVAIMMIVNNALLRYALPIFPWLAISAAANIEVVFHYADERKNSWLGTVLFCLLMVFLFSTRPILTLRIAENYQRLPVNYFLGRESPEDYLRRNLPVYSAFRFIDSQPGGPHRVLSVGNEFRLYSQSRIDGVYDVSEAHELLISARDGGTLAQNLLQKGYDYILINRPEIEFVYWKYTYPILEQTDFLITYCELLFADREIYVFRIHPKPLELPVRKNLIDNPGFEDGTESDLIGWIKGGNVFIDSNSVSGNNSLLLFGPLSDRFGWVEQAISVEPDKIYTLSYWTKAQGENAISLVQINFLDGNQHLINENKFWKNVKTEWHQRTYHFKSPSNASYLRLQVSLGNYEGVLFDNFCLAQGQKCEFEEK